MPNRSSFIQDTKRTNVLVPASRSADATSSVLDTQGYDEVGFVVQVGAAGQSYTTTNKIEMVLQVSDSTNTLFAAPDGKLIVTKAGTLDSVTSGIFATIDADAKANTVYEVAYLGNKRYARVFADFGGTHTGAIVFGLTGIQSRAAAAPAT